MTTRYRHVIGNPIMGLGSYARLRVPRTTVQGGGNNLAIEPDVGSTGGLDGTLTGWADVSLARVADVPAVLTGRSIVLDRTLSQHVVLAGSIAAGPASQSLSFWYKRTSANDVAVFGYPGDPTSYAPLFYTGDSTAYVGAGTTINQVNFAVNPTLDTWYHGAITAGSTTEIKFYVDGSLINTKSLIGGLTAISYLSNCGPGYFWNGNLKDLRVYSETLTLGEVGELTAGGEVTGKTPIHRWTFD